MKQRFLKLALMVLLLLGTFSAFATAHAMSTKCFVNANTLPVYAAQDEKSKVLGTMAFGQSITLTDLTDTWATVKNSKGKAGYCRTSGLIGVDPNLYAKTVKLPKNTALYNEPDADKKAYTVLKSAKSAKITAVTPDGKWYRVKYGSKYLYVQATAFTEKPKLDTFVYITEWYRVGMVNAKHQSGTAFFGEAHKLVSEASEVRYTILSGGKNWNIRKEMVSRQDPNVLFRPMYIQAPGNALMKQTAKVTYASISKNTKVLAVAKLENDGQITYRVKVGSKYYMVDSLFLSDTKAPEDGISVCLKKAFSYGQIVRRSASLSSKQVGTIRAGEKVKLIGVSKSWAKIRMPDGTVGYMPYGTLEKTK